MSTTINDSVVSVRLSADVLEQLDEIAAEMDRTRSYLISQAVREFVEREYASLEHIREGEQDVAAGRLIPHSEIATWITDLSEGKKRQPPRVRK